MHARHLFLLGIVLTRIAAADAAPTQEVIAARFTTTTCAQPCVTPKASDWHLWRGENRVEVRAASGEVGEIWRRDGQGRVNFIYVEPDRKRGIEYNATDLRMIVSVQPPHLCPVCESVHAPSFSARRSPWSHHQARPRTGTPTSPPGRPAA